MAAILSYIQRENADFVDFTKGRLCEEVKHFFPRSILQAEYCSVNQESEKIIEIGRVIED